MTTDEDLIELIENLRDAASRSLKNDHLAEDQPVIWEVAAPLTEAMDKHPEFAQPFNKFFLGKQIGLLNQHQSINLLRYAVRHGATEALAWYRRVWATETTKMRVVGQVFGLFVDKRHRLSNGVTLLPVSHLPDSSNSLLLKQSVNSGLGAHFPAAVMFEVSDVRNEHNSDSSRRFVEIAQIMRKTITAFVLAGEASPVMAECWQEFVDPDLEAAEYSRSWMRSFDEGQVPSFGMHVTHAGLDWVEKYLQLPADVANACDVPIARLSLANRRVSAGDKAIDGSICLEALLSGRSRGELTHRLSVRLALLLGRSLEERQQIARKARDFYQLRSNVVHGSSPKKEAASHEIARHGISLCLAALRAIVTRAQVPDPELWELTGGPPWNRYVE